MFKDLFIDIETYSSAKLGDCGAYKYMESPDFEILMVGYAFDDEPVRVIDLAQGEELPEEFIEGLFDPEVRKHAHNAVFERLAFRRIGYDIPSENWYCTMVKTAYCGLPLALDKVSKVLDLKDKKLETGKSLITYFSCPCKPTKTNGGRTRNYPQHAPEKWEMYKEYNKYDVLSEREIYRLLEKYEIPEIEREVYILDQSINDNGIGVDVELAKGAVDISERYSEYLVERSKQLSGMDNPNSVAQLKKFILSRVPSITKNITEKDAEYLQTAEGRLYDPDNLSVTAESIKAMLNLDGVHADPILTEVLENRQRLSRSSIKKYTAMLNCLGEGDRVRGTFQFYGANRTGRWAGRLLQLQNLTKNKEFNICQLRELVRNKDLDTLEMMYDDVSDILSQLVRPTLIAAEGKTLCVADFSAIEARVIAWFAKEQWVLDVFENGGDIYCATASQMFGVPVEKHGQNSNLRQKGKISVLALGYGGSIGALRRMGGDKMGLSDLEMQNIVKLWRESNDMTVKLWSDLEKAAKDAIRHRKRVELDCNVAFDCDDFALTMQLPSGRKLFYYHPTIREERVSNSNRTVKNIYYWTLNQVTKQWEMSDTYGGKLAENLVQATARDLLAYSMLNINKDKDFSIVGHVHDEVLAEVPEGYGDFYLNKMIELMCIKPDWAEGLPLNAAGFTSKWYMKD